MGWTVCTLGGPQTEPGWIGCMGSLETYATVSPIIPRPARPPPHIPTSEFAQGELFEILEDDQSLPEDVVQSIAKQLVRALHYLHSNRIIHRCGHTCVCCVCWAGAVGRPGGWEMSAAGLRRRFRGWGRIGVNKSTQRADGTDSIDR